MNLITNAIKTKISHMLCLLLLCNVLHANETSPAENTSINSLSQKLEVGDVVFIQVTPYPFQKVASTTHSWVNHVGIVVDTDHDTVVIAESTFPFSRQTPLNKFIARSDRGRVAVSRLNQAMSQEEKQRIVEASTKRLNIHYDTGFNLYSRGEFCSRFVREVIAESTGITVGKIETFQTLLDNNPEADLLFWRLWYLGHIPWQRETVTPASLYQRPQLKMIFDGKVV